VINVSTDGASNEWIARTACDAYDLAGPSRMVVMWSYLHRREHPDANLSDHDRRLHSVRSTMAQDFENFDSCRKQVHAHCADSNIIELVIPNFADVDSYLAWKRVRNPNWQPTVSWPQLLPPTLEEFRDLHPEIVAELRTLHGLDIDKLLEFYTIQQQIPECSAGVVRVDYLDHARDGHHFDIVTTKWVAKQVQNLLNS
jgi:hypothetical protein